MVEDDAGKRPLPGWSVGIAKFSSEAHVPSAGSEPLEGCDSVRRTARAGVHIRFLCHYFVEALFGCSEIRINPHVLSWVRVELELNSTSIHSNTCGLR
jgi:hypothetical protein